MRTRNSFFNFLANEGSHLLNIILSFLCRSVFIAVLSQEYLGVNGLFANILTVLSLAELGVGTAMTFHIYKPIAEGDEDAQCRLMNLYRKLYRWIAAFIAAAGLALVPFLDVLIKDRPDIPHLTFIYLLYLFNTVSSYFFSYKRAIIDAHQKQYIGTIVNTIFTTIQFLVQMLVLVLFKSFIVYLLVQIVCNVLTNIVVAWEADRLYPYLKKDTKSMPAKDVLASIKKNVGAMFIHRLGSVVVNDTDNLLMSAFVGIVSVGIYSNYQSIEYAINVALNGVFGAFTASIGNLGALGDEKKTFRVYKTLNFLGFWLYGFSAVSFMVLYNSFICWWVDLTGRNGSDYLFNMWIVLTIVVNFYLSGMRTVTLTFRDAMGLYWYDRYKPIFEIIINLTTSIVLAKTIGIAGIFLGTTISTLSTSFWVEPYVTYKHGFHQPVSGFFGKYALYAVSVCGVGGFVYWLCSHITMGGLPEIILRLLVDIIVYNGIIFLLYFRTENFRHLRDQIMVLINARKKAKEQKKNE